MKAALAAIAMSGMYNLTGANITLMGQPDPEWAAAQAHRAAEEARRRRNLPPVEPAFNHPGARRKAGPSPAPTSAARKPKTRRERKRLNASKGGRR